jgi:hypothetical protein
MASVNRHAADSIHIGEALSLSGGGKVAVTKPAMIELNPASIQSAGSLGLGIGGQTVFRDAGTGTAKVSGSAIEVFTAPDGKVSYGYGDPGAARWRWHMPTITGDDVEAFLLGGWLGDHYARRWALLCAGAAVGLRHAYRRLQQR